MTKKSTKTKKLIAPILIGVALLGIGLLLLRGFLLPLMANGADAILRPLIGSKATLQIEALYFNTSDSLNQLHSTAVTQPDAVFNTTSKGIISSQYLKSNLNLTPIQPFTTVAPFTNEGKWEPIADTRFSNQVLMAKTLLHVDDQRPYAYVALVKIDQQKIGIGAVAGIKHPGGTIGNPGPGKVPDNIKLANKLIAAFDGGFQYKDGAYGMVVNGKTYVPLQAHLATMFINSQGVGRIAEYLGEQIPADIVAIRQNGPLLAKDGQITSFTEQGKDTWGRTITNSIYTWRSGVGVDRDGNLIYAVGPSLHPETLAHALQAAGAINAMQLDINPYWVRFVLFKSNQDSTYSSTSLLKEMQNGGTSYIQGYQKDFFYLFSKM